MNTLIIRLALAGILVLALTILPMPDLLLGIRPPWVLMLILYLQFFLSDYFNLALVLMIGLILDVLLSTVLGEHALALSVVAWVANSRARRFRLFTIGQQMIVVGFLCFFYQLIILMSDISLGNHVEFTASATSTLISVLLWPWIRLIADDALLAKTTLRNYRR